MDKKATIYDLERYCKGNICDRCILTLRGMRCWKENLDETNDVVLDWCEQHPIKTRLTEFKKMFPNCSLDTDGYPEECVKKYDKTFMSDCDCFDMDCTACAQKFWDTEIK